MNWGKRKKEAENRGQENPSNRKQGLGERGKQSFGAGRKRSPGETGKRSSGGIRVQLVLSFIVPVIFVVLTGVISYQKAAKGMEEKYTESTTSVGSVAEISGQLMVYIRRLDDMSLLLNENMGELKKEVEKFKVE